MFQLMEKGPTGNNGQTMYKRGHSFEINCIEWFKTSIQLEYQTCITTDTQRVELHMIFFSHSYVGFTPSIYSLFSNYEKKKNWKWTILLVWKFIKYSQNNSISVPSSCVGAPTRKASSLIPSWQCSNVMYYPLGAETWRCWVRELSVSVRSWRRQWRRRSSSTGGLSLGCLMSTW